MGEDEEKQPSENDQYAYFTDMIMNLLSISSGARSTNELDNSLITSVYQHFLTCMVAEWLSHKSNPQEVVDEVFKRWKKTVRKTVEPAIQRHTEMMDTESGKRIAELSQGLIGDGETYRIAWNKKIRDVENAVKPIFDRMAEEIKKFRGGADG